MPADHRLPTSIKAEHQGWLDQLTSAEVYAAMDECDAVGLDNFLSKRNFSRPRVWVRRKNGLTRYPAKATAAIAIGFLPNGPKLSSKDFFAGYGESQSFTKLESLGSGPIDLVAAGASA